MHCPDQFLCYTSRMRRIIPILDEVFSFFVFVVILLLACYMALRIGTAGYQFFLSAFSGELLSSEALIDASSQRTLLGIAETVILIKAYKILVSYLRSHHISVEYIVEISIIALKKVA